MRAREYDSRLGRFTSRDPVEGGFKEPESMHFYAFANNNALVYSDPSGQFSFAEINVTSAIQGGLNALRISGAQKARQYFIKKLTIAARDQLISQLKSLLPFDDALTLLKFDPRNAGNVLQKEFENILCDHLGAMSQYLWIEPRVRRNGDVYSDGVSCGQRGNNRPGGAIPRPDLIVSLKPPTQNSGGILIGEIKYSGNAYEKAYVGGRQAGQWSAIRNYASKHCLTRSAVLFSFRGFRENTKIRLEESAIKSGSLVFFISVLDKP